MKGVMIYYVDMVEVDNCSWSADEKILWEDKYITMKKISFSSNRRTRFENPCLKFQWLSKIERQPAWRQREAASSSSCWKKLDALSSFIGWWRTERAEGGCYGMVHNRVFSFVLFWSFGSLFGFTLDSLDCLTSSKWCSRPIRLAVLHIGFLIFCRRNCCHEKNAECVLVRSF